MLSPADPRPEESIGGLFGVLALKMSCAERLSTDIYEMMYGRSAPRDLLFEHLNLMLISLENDPRDTLDDHPYSRLRTWWTQGTSLAYLKVRNPNTNPTRIRRLKKSLPNQAYFIYRFC